MLTELLVVLIVPAIVAGVLAFRVGRAWGRAEVAMWIEEELARTDRAVRPGGEFRTVAPKGGDVPCWPH